MNVTVDFECGGGKRLKQIEDDHWCVEANGDGSGYDKHFCIQVSSEKNEPQAVLHLEVHPDSDLGEEGARFFTQHFPSDIWHKKDSW